MLRYEQKEEKNQNISTGGDIEIADLQNLKDGEIPDSVINILIQKFLNKTFVNETDLNAKRESLIPTEGDIKWNIPDLIKHKTTKQYNDMLHDKYGYKEESGKDEKIPLAFYFDLSGSMESYSRMLALMAIKLLQKDVKVIIGINQYMKYQINSIPKNFKIDDLVEIFSDMYSFRKKDKLEIQEFDGKQIDKYLIEKKAKKVAIFSDFDPKKEIENLSENCEIYWFCTEERDYYTGLSLQKFQGHFYSMHSIKEFLIHLKNINNRYYEKIQRRRWEGEER